jgi:hypothetical protein
VKVLWADVDSCVSDEGDRSGVSQMAASGAVFPAFCHIGAHPTNNRYKTTHILYTNSIRSTFETIRQMVAALHEKALESVSD